jgi:hypothetical protein
MVRRFTGFSFFVKRFVLNAGRKSYIDPWTPKSYRIGNVMLKNYQAL